MNLSLPGDLFFFEELRKSGINGGKGAAGFLPVDQQHVDGLLGGLGDHSGVDVHPVRHSLEVVVALLEDLVTGTQISQPVERLQRGDGVRVLLLKTEQRVNYRLANNKGCFFPMWD